MASGHAAKLRSNEDFHVCKPPPGFAPTSGLLWICPDCWSELIYRPVFSWELGRVLNLWVRHWDPKGQGWVPLDRRRKHRKRTALRQGANHATAGGP